MLGERFSNAVALAVELHATQTRKSIGVPFVSHLLAVASLIIEDGGDEDEAIAGILHDVLEDQPEKVTAEQIETRFGARVREMVEACTDTPPGYSGGPKAPWRTRKEAYLAKLAASKVPARVCLADKLHNLRSMVTDYRLQGEELWTCFGGGRDGTLWYYRAIYDIFKKRGVEGRLMHEFTHTLDTFLREVA